MSVPSSGENCGRAPNSGLQPVCGSLTAPLNSRSTLRYTVRAVPTPHPAHGSFEELAMPLFSQLYNFACWLTSDRAAAEDLVQEAYLKAWKGFASYRQGTNFRAWIYRILRNTWFTSQAGLKAVESLDDEDAGVEPGTVETPESLLLAAREHEQIVRALEALPVHYREILLLCDLEEMSYQEISQALGIPMGTVMSRLSRARKAMRTQVAAAPGKGPSLAARGPAEGSGR